VKKSLLIATVLAVGLLAGALLVAGCSSGGESSTTSDDSSTSTTLESTTGSVTTTATTLEEPSTETSGSSTTVKVTSTTGTTIKAVRYEQNDPHIVYAGAWKTSTNSKASGGSIKYVDAKGGKVTITFEGTHLALIAKTSSQYGKASITLDGKKLGTIDLYSRDATFQKKVWGTGNLKLGTHTVVIAWTGTKRAAAQDTNINIDCVLVRGTLQ
jgi:hypothetical protein